MTARQTVTKGGDQPSRRNHQWVRLKAKAPNGQARQPLLRQSDGLDFRSCQSPCSQGLRNSPSSAYRGTRRPIEWSTCSAPLWRCCIRGILRRRSSRRVNFFLGTDGPDSKPADIRHPRNPVARFATGWGTAHPMVGGRRKPRDHYGPERSSADRADTKPAGGIPSDMRDEVPCQESPHKLDGSAARRDFPRRGCRMGGCPSYSRSAGMPQARVICKAAGCSRADVFLATGCDPRMPRSVVRGRCGRACWHREVESRAVAVF